MKFISRGVALFAALLSLASYGSAEQLTYSDTIPLSTTNWNRTLTVPQFDPALGTLISVQISFEGEIAGTTRYENTDAGPTTIVEQLSATISLLKPDLTVVLQVTPTYQTVNQVPVFDGTIDFAGPSGATHLTVDVTDSDAKGPYTEDNAFFTGPGDLVFPVTASAQSFVSGAGNLISGFSTDASAIISVTYNYDALPSCDPTVGDLSFENLTCGGATSTIQLNGSDSIDDNSETLSFHWSTNCPNASFSDETAISPTMTFDSIQNGTPTACSVTLSVVDNSRQKESCQLQVSVEACSYDCNGTLNGQAKLDSCGVCEGSNECFNCTDSETGDSSLSLDSNSIAQNSLVKQAVKLRRTITKNPKYGADILALAVELHNTLWELAWSLPSVITSCANVQLCQSVSNEGFVNQFVSSSEGLKSLVTTALKGLKTKDKKQLKKIKQLKKAAKKFADQNRVLLETIPAQSLCVS